MDIDLVVLSSSGPRNIRNVLHKIREFHDCSLTAVYGMTLFDFYEVSVFPDLSFQFFKDSGKNSKHNFSVKMQPN